MLGNCHTDCANSDAVAKVIESNVQLHVGRPIFLTPVLAKVPESFTCQWLTKTAIDDIDQHQFLSLKGSSTAHALVELVHRWQEAMDHSGKMFYVLLIDYSKPLTM